MGDGEQVIQRREKKSGSGRGKKESHSSFSERRPQGRQEPVACIAGTRWQESGSYAEAESALAHRYVKYKCGSCVRFPAEKAKRRGAYTPELTPFPLPDNESSHKMTLRKKGPAENAGLFFWNAAARRAFVPLSILASGAGEAQTD